MPRDKFFTVIKRSESRCACGQKNRNARPISPITTKGRTTPTRSAFFRRYLCLDCDQEFVKTTDMRR